MRSRLAGGGEMEGGVSVCVCLLFFNCAAGCRGEPEGYNSSHSALSWTTELQHSWNCLLTASSVEHDLDSSFSRFTL